MSRALDPQRILCVAPNWVGDSLFFLPAVDALKRRFAGAELDLLARASIAALLKDGGRFDRAYSLPAGTGRWHRFQALWKLRQRRYDLAVVFPDSFSTALAARLSGAGVRVGRVGEGRAPLLSRGYRLPRRDRSRHVVDEYLDLALACGAEADASQRMPRLAPPSTGMEERQRLFREHGLGAGLLVGLCPTSAFGPSKQWPARHWVELARRLRELRYSVVFFCAPLELDAVAPMAREAGGAAVLAPSLPGLAACLQACEMVVANDSGPLHMAAAVGARCLGLYGPIDPRWSAPQSPRAQALYLGLSCSPCFAKVCPLKHHDCLETLGVDQVLDAFQQLLKR
ncbi:MAG TPA: lipopolysaccharide heptosyltransferase II [bacterium]|nr:lipopolysaccharide heptosyltransferase II [bacterium]